MSKTCLVKPELFRNEDLFAAEQQSGLPLRLALIGLLTCCDRKGRFKWQPRSLKLDALPYDEVNFEQVLDVLCEGGFIKKDLRDDKIVGLIPSITKKALGVLHSDNNPQFN